MNNLVAGRELDTLVAAQVMGEPCPPPVLGDDQWSEVFCRNHDGQLYTSPQGAWYAVCEYDQNDDVVWYPRPYSTSIASAWEVVERLRRGQHGGAACVVELHITDNPVEKDSSCRIFGPDTHEGFGEATEMPEAICLAALKAVGVEA